MKRQAWLSVVAALAFSGCVSGAGAPLSRVPEAPLKTTGEVSKGSEGPPVELVELPSADARLDVPGFDGATAWLNVDHALSKEELKGRVVVVDFWTSCCINCLHTIPTLQKIEERFRGQPVVVIGVHSPKFEEEQKVERLRDFLRGSGIEHPIAVDAEMAIWRAWGVEGWPTVAVLDVAGRAIWAASGEPGEDELTRVVASALEEGRGQGKLARGELPGVRAEKETAGALRYPGKVLALESGGLAIADTGHNRVVLLDKGGRVEAVVGSGQKGKLDGAFADASFNQPEGMTESGGDLYVADTYNHLIRKIDLRARAVTTVAGTGELGAGPLARDEKPALSLPLRSPWDLLDIKGTIYVAMAGTHQIAAFDPRRKSIRLFAGNGREARVDGPLLEAAFAQPSALATDGKEIFVLDSETSSVRAIDAAKGQVRTVVGLDLFVFGDVDGDRTTTRLQHPIGMTFADGAVWVADSYNSKVKRIDPRTGVTRTALGGADRRELAEPAGIAAGPGALFIADTNHHRVLRLPLPLKSSARPEPLALKDLAAPPVATASPAAPRKVTVNPADPVASLGSIRIPPGALSQIRVRWEIPSGTGVNEEAPFRVVWTEAPGLTRIPDTSRAKGAEVKDGFDLPIEPASGAKSASLTGVLDMVVCDLVTHAVCVPVRRTLKASFAIEAGATPSSPAIALPNATR
jgi:thiol-disulfide isomerase/thioredoxin/sugar lactone lactonase YvrE